MVHQILTEVVILVGFSVGLATLLHYLRQPPIAGFIIAGMIVGPYGLDLVKSLPAAESIAELGAILLMFTIGLEFSFKRLQHFFKLFLKLGIPQIAITIVLVAGIYGLLNPDVEASKSVFVGCLVALSSTAIVMKLLQDSREIGSPFGNASVAVLLSQDIAVIPMMLAVPFFGSFASMASGFQWQDVGLWLLEIIGVFALLFVGARWVVPVVLEKVTKTRSKEVFFFTLILLCLGVAWMVETAGLSLSLGSFVAGIMISDSPYGKQATADIVPLRENFLALLFASVGMLIDIEFVLSNGALILSVFVLVTAVKVGVVYGLGLLNRLPSSTALITGFMLFQVGEFSFIMAQKGASVGLLTPWELQFFFSVSALSMVCTPIFFKLVPKLVLMKKIRKDSMDYRYQEIASPDVVHPPEQSGHTIIVGHGVAGGNLSKVLKNLDLPYRIIEQNFNSVKSLKAAGEDVVYGDASSEEILEAAGIHDAALVIITASGVSMTAAIARQVKALRPDVKIIIRVQYSREAQELKSLGDVELIVAEYEITVELIGKALTSYGVAREEIESCMFNARKELGLSLSNLSDYIRNTLDLPAWEAISMIRTHTITDTSKAVGSSLRELELRTKTDSTLVAVYRDKKGAIPADGDFSFKSGDVLYLIGNDQAVDRAVELLQ